jgi:hypothetical protein
MLAGTWLCQKFSVKLEILRLSHHLNQLEKIIQQGNGRVNKHLKHVPLGYNKGWLSLLLSS